jgi:hypothetical protein
LNGNGPWSPIVLITAATIPASPPEPVYSSSSSSQIVLNLFRSNDDGGMPVEDYELEIDDGTSSTSTAEASASTWSKITQYIYATHGLTYTVL